jgi:hypothetical protein
MPPSTRHRSLTARGRVTYAANRLALLPALLPSTSSPVQTLGRPHGQPVPHERNDPSALAMAPDRVVMQSPRSAGQCVQQTQQPLLARQ